MGKNEEFLSRLRKYKNINRFDYKALKFGDYIFIGMRGGSVPGRVKSKTFRKHKRILERLFKKFKKENKKGKIIFVSHNIAYDTKLDILSKKARKFAAKGFHRKIAKKIKKFKHYGSKLARKIINKYHPILHIGGHIHESSGKDRIAKTILVNPGAAHEGKATLIEIDEGKIKKIKFIK